MTSPSNDILINKSYCDYILVAATPAELIPREVGIGTRFQQPYPLTTLDQRSSSENASPLTNLNHPQRTKETSDQALKYWSALTQVLRERVERYSQASCSIPCVSVIKEDVEA
jgi:hypothetical protein